MAELRISGGGAMGIQRDKLGSPSTGSEDGGGCMDLAEIAQELDQDEFDGIVPNGKNFNLFFSLTNWSILRKNYCCGDDSLDIMCIDIPIENKVNEFL